MLGAAGLATVEAVPGAGFVLQAAGIGTLLGTAYAYGRRRFDPAVHVGETIAVFTCGMASIALIVELFSWLT